MNLPEEGIGLIGKIIAAAKDFPLWILAGLAVALDVLLLFPRTGQMPQAFTSWLWVAVVVCNVLAVSKAISVGHKAWVEFRATTTARRTFVMSPIESQCIWSMTKQADESTTTQMNTRFLVKNLTSSPLRLVTPRLIRPRIRGEIVHKDVMVRAVDNDRYGTAAHSGHAIPAHETLPASVAIIIRGVPKAAADETLYITLGVTNDEGHEERVKVALRGVPSTKPAVAVRLEAVSEISDPIVRNVVSVLQSEVSRYARCGRERCGLGSVHIVYRGQELMGVGGTDGWDPNSTKDQNLVQDPQLATLRSDNLDALIAIHARLSTDAARAVFVAALKDRLNEGSGYLSVSYFIVSALWRIGQFHEALRQARANLPTGEIKVYGLSNVLLMLNGLLRYRYPDFTPEMIDAVEGFIGGLQEHTFQIPEKIASVRTRRLQNPINYVPSQRCATRPILMYVLDALRQPLPGSTSGEELAEFRLLCSGTLYNGNVQTFDWTKSDASRSLLRGRVVLVAVSRPIDSYPQELMLRVPASMVTEEQPAKTKTPAVSKMFFPHREIAEDLAALLTVLLRRLITVHCHVCTTQTDRGPNVFGLQNYPLPISRVRPGATWLRRPIGVITMPDGAQQLDDSASAPVAVDVKWLASALADLPSMPAAKTIVACARLYSEGMQLIEDRPEMAYQIFIAAIETLASEALKDYSPTDDEKIKSKSKVYERAIELGLHEEAAREMAIVATQGMSWTSKKFQQCLLQYTDESLWTKDDLFITLDPFLPKRADFARALRDIYNSRSGALHTGESFPATVGLGTSPQIPVEALAAALAGDPLLPPVTWFERVVQLALFKFIESQRPVQPETNSGQV